MTKKVMRQATRRFGWMRAGTAWQLSPMRNGVLRRRLQIAVRAAGPGSEVRGPGSATGRPKTLPLGRVGA